MEIKISDQLNGIIKYAREEAMRTGSYGIGPDHLFLGLIRHEDNTAFRALRDLGLDPDIPFVVFMMGSLGSSTVSQVIDEACGLFDPTFQVVIAAGKDNDYTFRTPSEGKIRIVPYVDGKAMLKGCALAVTRAGATTMAEIGAIGCAAILIPSPYVQNNHQVYNALELVRRDAAVMIEEKDLTAEKLATEVNRLMNDKERCRSIREHAYEAGHREAADDMILWMEDLINE